MSNQSKWRTHARATIAKLIPSIQNMDKATAKATIEAAYPFGPRLHWPYKIWREECRRMLPNVFGIKQKPLPQWLGGDK